MIKFEVYINSNLVRVIESWTAKSAKQQAKKRFGLGVTVTRASRGEIEADKP